MKISSLVKRTIIQSVSVLILASLVQTDAFARGGRGGGGGGGRFTREGPASSGGFSSRSSSGRSSAQASRSTNQQNRQSAVAQNRQAQTNTRQQGATNRQQNRQNYANNAQQNRQNFANNNWDNYYRPGWGAPVGAAAVGVAAGAAAGYAAGAIASPTGITTLPCTPAPVVVGQASYYPCNGTWYQKAYSGDEVTYAVVNAPAGY